MASPVRQLPEVTHYPREEMDLPMNDQGNYGWRIPFTYEPDTNALHLGNSGNYHCDIPSSLSFHGYNGWIGKEHPDFPGYPVGMRIRNDTGLSNGQINAVQQALIPYHPEASTYIDSDNLYGSDADWNGEMVTGKVASILDPIAEMLPPEIWLDPGSPAPKLKPQVSSWLKSHIYDVLNQFHPDAEKWAHLVITGSLTTFQYSPDSDLDVSVFVDPAFMPDWSRSKLIGLVLDKLDGTKVAGTSHPIQTFIVPQKITQSNLYQPGLRSGYSLDTDTWIVPPDKNLAMDTEQQENGFYTYALLSSDKMARLLKDDPKRAAQFWEQIHHRRRRDQALGKGDRSEANLVYKFLFKRGLAPELEQATGEHIAKEAAWEDHFVNQLHPVADAYDALPNYDPMAVHAWKALARDSEQRANQLRGQYNISETDDPEPYADHQAMFDDINRGNFAVSRANSEHPIWTPQQNVNFRIVHDLMGHYPTGGDFGWQGENLACGNHFKFLDPNAQQALMTECLGQTGSAIRNGGFGPQKVGLMNNLLAPAQQTYSASPRDFCHRHIRHGIYKLPARTSAMEDKPRVLMTKFRPDPVHPRGLSDELPFIYDPNDNIVHLGPAQSYHWQLINQAPELKPQYDMNRAFQGAPFAQNPNHLHGRMEWPSKNIYYYNSSNPEVNQLRDKVSQGLGGQEAPSLEDGDWSDDPASGPQPPSTLANYQTNPCPECGAQDYEPGEDDDMRKYWHCNSCGHHQWGRGQLSLTPINWEDTQDNE